MQILEAYDLTGSLRTAASLEGTRDMSDALKGQNSDLVLDPRIRGERRRRASDSKEAQEEECPSHSLSGVLTPTVHCVPTAAVV
jgi:hypothetical protein